MDSSENMPGSVKIINLKCTAFFQLLYLKSPFHSVSFPKIVLITPANVFMFLSCPHCLLFATRNPISAQVQKKGLGTPWAHKTGQLGFLHRSSTSKDSTYSLCSCQKPLNTRMSAKQERYVPSMIHRGKTHSFLCDR